jgi:hypothetical protein
LQKKTSARNTRTFKQRCHPSPILWVRKFRHAGTRGGNEQTDVTGRSQFLKCEFSTYLDNA